MERPYLFTIMDETKTKFEYTNIEPSEDRLKTYVSTNNPENPGQMELKKTKTVFIDLRFLARIRLYSYVAYTKKGIKAPDSYYKILWAKQYIEKYK